MFIQLYNRLFHQFIKRNYVFGASFNVIWRKCTKNLMLPKFLFHYYKLDKFSELLRPISFKLVQGITRNNRFCSETGKTACNFKHVSPIWRRLHVKHSRAAKGQSTQNQILSKCLCVGMLTKKICTRRSRLWLNRFWPEVFHSIRFLV